MPSSTCDGPLTGQLVETAYLTKKLPELRRACAKMPFLLCGPPGCGKKSALRMALGDRRLGMHDLAMISNEHGTKLDSLKELVRTNLFGQQVLTEEGETEPSVLVLYGAEHLGADCVEFLREHQAVLVASDRSKVLTPFPTTWLKRQNLGEVVDFLRLLFPRLSVPEAQDVAKSSEGDLRQARLHVLHPEFWQHGGGTRGSTSKKERAPHALFDAQDALCHGHRGELAYGASCWAQRNHLKIDETIEKHAGFAETMTTWDVFGAIVRDSQEYPDALCSRPAIAELAVRQLAGKKRGRFELERPEEDPPSLFRNWGDESTGKRRKGTQRFDEARLRKLLADTGGTCAPDKRPRPAAAARESSTGATRPQIGTGGASRSSTLDAAVPAAAAGDFAGSSARCPAASAVARCGPHLDTPFQRLSPKSPTPAPPAHLRLPTPPRVARETMPQSPTTAALAM